MPRTSRKKLNDSTVTVEVPKRQIYRVGAYVRLSAEDRKKEGDSIETQQAIIAAYVSERHDCELVEIYIDNGLSGQSFERPAFTRMIADMEIGKINCCVTKDLSRIGRNAIDTGYYIEKYFPSHNIRFVAINDDYDSASGNSGDIMLPLKNLINEVYALDIGRKTSATKQMRIQEGAFIGKVPPYGYRKHPDNCHKLLLDEDAAPVVKRIFQMHLEGAKIIEIVDYLNASDSLPPCYYFYTKGWTSKKDMRRGTRWSRSAITKLLKNQVYCGDMAQGKFIRVNHTAKSVPKSDWVVIENTHEAIIKRSDFARAQELFPGVKRTSRYSTPTSAYVFKGKIYCGHCGYAMARHRSGEDTYVYNCKTRTIHGKNACIPVSIREKDLKETLLALLHKQIDIFAKEQSSKSANRLASKEKAELQNIQAQIERNNGFLKGLYESMITGDITADDYRELKQSYESKLQTLMEQESRLRTNLLKRDVGKLKHQRAADNIGGLYGIEDLTADALHELVDKVNIFQSKQIQVYFKFTDETGEVG